MTINGVEVTDGEIVSSYQAVKAIPKTDREPTFFEYTTAMALHLFGKAEVDWAIIETGMGGRLDATNVLSPALSIISNISMEHRFYLGNTIAEITGEKGGIIKHNTPVITGVTQKTAVEVLQKIASEKSASLYRLGEEFKVRRCKNGCFSYSGIDHQWKNMKTGLPGSHQVDNASLILAACEILIQKGIRLELDMIKNCLATYSWPGRLEIIHTKSNLTPEIIIDGSHNLMAARKLGQFLRQKYAHKELTLVIGILDDKPFESIMQSLLPSCAHVILTEPDIDRSLPPEKLMPFTKSIVNDTVIVEDVTSAVTRAIDTTASDGAICIAGSLYVVGEAKQALKNIGITD
ncbi:MAG: bifunctional folylpolyglutamate synthase/dihydrofolate synthase [Deltaproteobacteria bacterium]|nr:MAG: bifunctional folylpolyglutamate synthase/dihydrofolate synthase [Deltaproteobacteria bacterium]